MQRRALRIALGHEALKPLRKCSRTGLLKFAQHKSGLAGTVFTWVNQSLDEPPKPFLLIAVCTHRPTSQFR